MLFLVIKWRLSSSFFYWKHLDCGLIQANSQEEVAEKMELERFADALLQSFYFKKQPGNSLEKITQAAWQQQEIIGYEIYPLRELTEPI